MCKAVNSNFMARGRSFINDQSKSKYRVGNEIISNTEILKSNLCDYSDAYILVRADITAVAVYASHVPLKKYSPFTKCISNLME